MSNKNPDESSSGSSASGNLGNSSIDGNELLSARKIMQASTAASKLSSSCSTCVDLLKEVLQQTTDSRPHTLLSSMVHQAQNENRAQSPPRRRSTEILATAAARSPPLSTLKWREAPDGTGVQVEIPAPVQNTDGEIQFRHWSLVRPDAVLMTMPDVTRAAISAVPSLSVWKAKSQLATSASADNMDSPVSPGSDRTALKAPRGTEWLQLSCKQCGNDGAEAGARAFLTGPSPLGIVVCSNRLVSRSRAEQIAEMAEILTHELVHVYDVRQLQMDLQDCETLAYSEVRAARDAECANSGCYWWPQGYCVRQKALRATLNLFPNTAKDCLQQVFQTAMKDKRPLASATIATAVSDDQLQRQGEKQSDVFGPGAGQSNR